MSEIVEKVSKIAEAVNAAQEANEKNWSDTKATAAEAATKAMQAIQDANEHAQKMKALEEGQSFLEKQLARMPIGGGAGSAEHSAFEEKARNEFISYMRRGETLGEDTYKEVCGSIAKKTLCGVDNSAMESYTKSLIAGSNADGGYFVRPERSAQMVQRIFETSPIRSLANVVTTTSDSLEMIIDDNEATSGGWVGEVASREETGTPQIGLLTIPVHEQFAQPEATQKMLDDAGFDIEAWLSRKVTDKMSREENKAFVVGDGSQKPKGFLSYDAWATPGVYERNKLEQVNSGAAGDFTGDGLKKIQDSLIEEYQANATWGIKRKSFANIITLKDSQGRYIFDTRFLQTRDPMNLLGKQVVFMNDLPDVASNALALVYGDFSIGYTVVDRLGFRVIRDVYTSKPKIKFYTTKRTGGAVTNFQALKIQKLSA